MTTTIIKPGGVQKTPRIFFTFSGITVYQKLVEEEDVGAANEILANWEDLPFPDNLIAIQCRESLHRIWLADWIVDDALPASLPLPLQSSSMFVITYLASTDEPLYFEKVNITKEGTELEAEIGYPHPNNSITNYGIKFAKFMMWRIFDAGFSTQKLTVSAPSSILNALYPSEIYTVLEDDHPDPRKHLTNIPLKTVEITKSLWDSYKQNTTAFNSFYGSTLSGASVTYHLDWPDDSNGVTVNYS